MARRAPRDPLRIPVVVVAADPVLRSEIGDRLTDRAEVRVVGQVAPESLQGFLEDEPDADAAVWALDWARAVPAELRSAAQSGVRILGLATTAEEAARLRAAGALGVVSIRADPEELQAAVQAVAAGLIALDPRLDPSEATDPPVESLTPREMDVLRLVAEGYSNRAVAHTLGIRESTVKDHVNRIMDKLDARSRTEAVVVALRRGLLSV